MRGKWRVRVAIHLISCTFFLFHTNGNNFPNWPERCISAHIIRYWWGFVAGSITKTIRQNITTFHPFQGFVARNILLGAASVLAFL